MAKLSRLIVRTRSYVEQLRKIDRQPELMADHMADVKRRVHPAGNPDTIAAGVYRISGGQGVPATI